MLGGTVVTELSPAERLAAELASGADGRPLLERFCAACLRLLPVDGAVISVLTGPNRLEPVASTDDVAAGIADLQFTVGVGPCLDAVHSSSPVLVADLADVGDPVVVRWPAFAGAAAEAGIRAVYAFPLRLGAIMVGALDLYRYESGSLDAEAVRLALLVADTAAVALLDLRATGEDGVPGADGAALQHAEVYQATGMVMAQLGVSAEEALVRLRAFAFGQDRLVGDVARDIVTLRLRLDKIGD